MSTAARSTLGGRTAVVTGAGSGIGRAIAAKLGRAGAQVHVADVDGQRADTVVSEITAAGGHARAHVIDVTDAAAVEALADGLFSPAVGSTCCSTMPASVTPARWRIRRSRTGVGSWRST